MERKPLHEELENRISIDSSKPLYTKRFDFYFDKDGQLDVDIVTVDPDDWMQKCNARLSGDQRERIVRENRKKLLKLEPFSEYVRFYKVSSTESEDFSIGVLAFEILFLTLNSRFRVTKELSQVSGITPMKVLVPCSFQKKPCLVLSVKDMIKTICAMNTRLLERRLIKLCLMPKLLEIYTK